MKHVLHTALSVLLTVVISSTCMALSPAEILEKVPVLQSGKAGGTASASVEFSKSDAPMIILNTDGLYRKNDDIAFINSFKEHLKSKYGISSVISPYCCQANNHVNTIKNCPKGHWIVTAASGICAGTYRDMVLGTTGRHGYLKKYWKTNEIKGLIFLNLSTKFLLKDVDFLPRAWDDNFSPASFKGLKNPYKYLTDAGFHIVESSRYRDRLLNPKRVPVLSEQIARIVLGDKFTGSTSDNENSGKSQQKATKATASILKKSASPTGENIDRIKKLQRALQTLGYYKGCKIDGWFGPYMQLAVLEFQRNSGQSVSGTVDDKLYNLIISKASVASKSASKGASSAKSGSKGAGNVKSGKEKGGTVGGASSQSMVSSSLNKSGLAKYLEPTRYVQSQNPSITSLAKKLKGATPLKTAQNILAKGHSIGFDMYYNSKQGAVGTLNAGSGNCVDQAHLMIALLRAAGIPAMYGHSSDCAFASGRRIGHVWAYAWINGKWLIMDPTSTVNSVGSAKSFRAIGSVKYYRELPF